MSPKADHIAQLATQGGAAVAGGSWLVNSVGWLNTNSAAVLALCGIVGALCSVAGLIYTAHRGGRK